MKIKETRRMWPDKLQALCTKYDWFTRGTSEDYDKFLKLCGGSHKHIDTDTLMDMALYILSYSDYETYEGLELEGIMGLLAEICISTFEVIED